MPHETAPWKQWGRKGKGPQLWDCMPGLAQPIHCFCIVEILVGVYFSFRLNIWIE